ncbi:MAG: alpha/beta hydrolase [Chloroflexi bacterium]|nr:alpha/beta hydrolase [Chloroflexota bacterium]
MSCPLPYYETHGTQGPYVLMVHGIYSARSHWLPNRDAIAEWARPVILELFGHGRSPTPDDPDCYHPDRYVEYFEQIREALGAERWFVVGQSLGAALTLRYSLLRPQRVIAQAFTNSSSAFAPPESQHRMARDREDRIRQLEANPPDPALSPMNPARNRRVPPEVRRALADDVALHSPLGVARTSMYTAARASLHGRGHENTVPTLLLVGEREERFREARRYIESHLACLEVVGLNGGHGANLDDPQAFNRALREFFERFTDGAGA